MKILVLNWQDITNPLGGGAETHLHEIFKRIVAMGHDVTLFCCSVDGRPNEEFIDGIRILRQGSRNLFNYYVPIRYCLEFRHEGYDIVIDDINKIPFYTPLFVREPILGISHHFFGTSIFRETNFIFGLYVLLAEYLVNFVYRTTRFAVVSKSTFDEFMKRGFKPQQFSIIYNALDHSAFPMNVGKKSAHPVISYFGRVKKYKSPDHLLQAFSQISTVFPDAELHYIGGGDFIPELKQMASHLQLDTRVIFHGRVDETEKLRLLSMAWCMVNTSMKEGWGITTIEANACGTPVLSANVPGLRDSVRVGQSGDIYEYGDIEQLSQKLTNIIENEEYRQHVSYGAVEWASSFSWDTSAKEMINLIADIANSTKN
ncbi:MAG: glycosyltransferase family 4 protein [Candidatus Kapabacteria bacterium]|nr:glycosyltransferase family 4 protein [Candidatus Kapabacteria bacterium]